MKKLFASLMVGFGAALGVFVAIAMPPGGWGVAVGVGLGLLGCVPLLIVLVLLIGRGHGDRRLRDTAYEEAQQPIIIIQQPPAIQPETAYGYVEAPAYGYGYAPAPEYAYIPERPRPERVLPSRRRRAQQEAYYRPQPDYYEGDYYGQPGYEQYGYQQQYETPPAQPQQYDAYYGPPVRQPAYGYQPQPEYYEEYEDGYEYDPRYQLQPEPREIQPRRATPTRKQVRPRRVKTEDAVEADFRMIGDNE
jgi:hypothetical protein